MMLLLAATLLVGTNDAPVATSAAPVRPVMQAVRTSSAISLDGVLDEEAWKDAQPAASFSQIDPNHGAPAAFATEVRVLYDARTLYIGARMHDPAGRKGVRVATLRRDFDPGEADFFSVALDPFGDGRVATAFEVNPWGAIRDLQVFEDILFDQNWDAVWRAKTTRDDAGWTAEIAIPFSSVRYPRDVTEWGINFARSVRRVGSFSGWSLWPLGNNSYRMTFAGKVGALDPPRPSLNLQVVPFGVARGERNETEGLARDDDTSGDVGVDAKWAPTTNSVVDLTVNTDFAQADVDRQIVNLTRFSVFFPERRSFFLESASLFTVGYINNFHPFFSRRIGLSAEGEPIPIDGGVRYVRRTADRSNGALVLHTREQGATPGTTFAVLRATENFGGQNRIGGMLVMRRDDPKDGQPESLNLVPAADIFLRFGTLIVESTASASSTQGEGGDGLAGNVDVYNRAPWGTVGAAVVAVGENYEARTGFVTRPAAVLYNPYVDLQLRPAWKPAWLRMYRSYTFAEMYREIPSGDLQDAYVRIQPFAFIFESGDFFGTHVTPNWQVLDAPFSPLPGVTLQPGRHDGVRYGFEAATDQSRKLGVFLEMDTGDFYGGKLDTFEAGIGARPLPHIAFFGRAERIEITDADGNFARADILAPELRLALNPALQLVAFWQKSTAADLEAWNVRLSWEFRPLSNAYLVYTDRTRRPEAPEVRTRDQQLVFKLTWLWQT